ncbi:YfhJ family protein [Salinibacillus xinjiangensis]|uniref:WVELL protein n=1 Tax=Salinibacillus xinjiangensis TaxID=1229268 RepID=A0A6G1X9C0_9BACI|nr:YfhJ family protein [Salinibacillus xinjiangensis]MRG87529.1 hypothetical protein [Salinibacillus xinjiangensis]
MEEIFQRLSRELRSVNDTLTEEQARTWVEMLWEDFETTRAKAGRKYKGQEVTESIVKKWIQNYGPRLHEVNLDTKKWQDKMNRGPLH